ncbi:LamG domain-containing protein [Peredibacter sp. HCB2-198]|uniref:LamG domain-containing protein n=1 Tax=Peredibacter sp. HCB2-198 TaxID=3383025 RepID=UPI0038B42EDB
MNPKNYKVKINKRKTDNYKVKSNLWFALLFLVGCNSPIGNGDITVTFKNNPVTDSTLQPFIHQIPFTTGTETNYVLSDASKIEINGNLVRLKPKIFIDQDSSPTGFGSGLLRGVTWDSTKNVLRLNSTTNIFEHGIDWSPKIANVIAYYKLDRANYTTAWAELEDSGPYALHGISSTSFSNGPGKINGAAYFDGTRYVGTPDYDQLEGHQKFSIATWVRPTNLAVGIGQAVVAKRNDYNNEQSFDFFFYTGNKLNVDIDGADNRFESRFVFENDKWYHIVVTFDGTQPSNNRVRLYVNGHLDTIATENATAIPNYSAYLLFGNMGGGPYEFYGQIDEVVFWNETLNYDEVMYMYAKQSPQIAGGFVSRVFDSQETSPVWPYLSAVTPLPFNKEIPGTNGSELATSYSEVSPNLMNGILSYWKLNELVDGGPNSIVDSVGTNHGTISGTLELGDYRGIFSRATYFSGGKISANGGFLNNLPEFSISTWVSPSYTVNGGGGSEVSIIGKDEQIEIGIQSGYFCARTAIDNTTICAPTTANTGEWTHVTVTGDASTFSLYVNGVLVNSTPHTGPTYGANASDFNMGSDVWTIGSGRYVGLMDEVAVWNRALTPNEIKNLYRRGGQQLLYQVRSCANPDCSDQDGAFGLGWKGPNGDEIFHFSENHNSNLGSLQIPFLNFAPVSLPNRYFQYKVVFTSNDVNNLCDYGSGPAMCSPELKSITVGPSYTTSAQTITTTLPVTAPYESLNLNGFVQTLGANGCAGQARYSLSSDGTNFYYHDGSNWIQSSTDWVEANDAISLGLVFNTFPTAIGTGNLFVKAHLQSNGAQACEIDNLQISGIKP